MCTITDIIAELTIEGEERIGKLQFPLRFRERLTSIIIHKKIFFAGGVLVVATTFANILNFAFAAYLGRVLDLTNFALVSLIGSFYAFSSMFFGPLSLTVNYRSGYLIGKFNNNAGYQFWKHIRRYAIYYGIALSLLWLVLSPLLNSFFKTESLLLFLSFTAIIVSGFAAGVDKGFLSARLLFVPLALVVLAEPIIKILAAFLLTWMHLLPFMYLTIPFSFFTAFLFGWIVILKQKREQKENAYSERDIAYFPKKFLWTCLLSGLSTLSFVSLDIVLAKHYLSPEDAGRYALVSLIGKTVYFLGGLASPFVIPLLSRDLGANKSTKKTLYFLLFFTFLLSFFGFLAFGVFGYITAPLLLGERARSIIPYLGLFLFAMMCFTISQIFVSFYQMQKVYSFPIVGFLLSILQIVLIVLNHATIFSIVLAMSVVGIVNLILMGFMHYQRATVEVIENNIGKVLKR
ncbi:MAG TPA: hypothetical protein VE090_01265 [Methylomirabilota bacterium]|nr:hypothetical protein [Methylomirabilota bacterium]